MQWFRLYHRILDDPDFLRLPDSGQAFWLRLLAAASRAEPRGRLAATDHDTIARLTCSTRRVVGEYLPRFRALTWVRDEGDRLVIDSWDDLQCRSDDVADRVAKHRKNKGLPHARNVTGNVTGNVTVTPPDTDADTDAEDQTPTVSLPPVRRKPTSKPVQLTLTGEPDERPVKTNPLWAKTEEVLAIYRKAWGIQISGAINDVTRVMLLKVLKKTTGMTVDDCYFAIYAFRWADEYEWWRKNGKTAIHNIFGKPDEVQNHARIGRECASHSDRPIEGWDYEKGVVT